MSHCKSTKDRFSEYLDGALTGVAMQEVAAHLDGCAECAEEFSSWRSMQQELADLGPAKAPADLALRLRVALSQEKAKTPKQSLARFQVQWSNTFAPFLLRASAGFASAVLLIGTAALLIGAFTSPDPVEASADSDDGAISAHFLYSMTESNSAGFSGDTAAPIGTQPLHEHGKASVVVTTDTSNPVVFEAFVNSEGRAYDYRIVSGPTDSQARAAVETLLLFSVFEPARVFGEPVPGVAVMTLTGVSVQG
ncbi:zf-HC2 domain-containing protein [Silvibacterium dinghuense]|uniref:Anti-sigma factor n=1 Tax=Silvibacterium dinghuense TaxID=1560006 RepID=A0A4Q1S9U5_9BACT|nr:zf-HC2 domain-containing protein [Silvibacterium dinghuense]RXS93456.1 anti-sigma factor [Silvibacterium dinghuense]GGH05989.1 hypothetical protein GCM10011586_22740 [Silvibacterium dinghuense]